MTKEQIARTWAFAIKNKSKKTKSIITACSREARLQGVRAGMRVREAKSLVPELKILVIGGRNV